MNDSPSQPSTDPVREPRESQRVTSLVVFVGVWFVTSCLTFVFATRPQNPFEAFTSLFLRLAIPFAVAPYALIVAGLASVVPRSNSEFTNLLIPTAAVSAGGLFGPHILTVMANALF